jgi:energy-converting hydrogenase Eha subunit B
MDATSLASALIMVVTLYAVAKTGVIQWTGRYLWRGLTTSRAVTLSGFIGGLLVGDALLKMGLGILGAAGTLALGDVISLSPEVFAVGVVIIILAFAVTGGD